MKQQRLVALDVLRGLTIAGMILVNSAGNWSHIYAPLRHAAWNGMTPADLIFPLFIFMMGMSMYISLKKFSFTLSHALLLKIVRRTAVIFLLGTLIYAADTCLYALRSALQQGHPHPWQEAFASLQHLRALGVLQRLALCYGIGALIVTTVRHRHLPYWIATLLAGYALILLTGDGFVRGPENILAQTDTLLLGTAHIYGGGYLDPEGILSTLPAIAQVLTGFCFGKVCMECTDMKDKLNRLFVPGSLLLIGGFVLQDLCPLNKTVWSPTFTLVTCGFSVLLLSILLWYIDGTGQFRKTHFLEVFGVNPLFCYMLSQLLYILLNYLPLGETSTHSFIYQRLTSCFGDNECASFLYAFLFVAVVWLAGSYLYKKKIYIKI